MQRKSLGVEEGECTGVFYTIHRYKKSSIYAKLRLSCRTSKLRNGGQNRWIS